MRTRFVISGWVTRTRVVLVLIAVLITSLWVTLTTGCAQCKETVGAASCAEAQCCYPHVCTMVRINGGLGGPTFDLATCRPQSSADVSGATGLTEP
jgi:hypothetical protein